MKIFKSQQKYDKNQANGWFLKIQVSAKNINFGKK